MLGEASTVEIARAKNTLGFKENRGSARKGGKIAGRARKDLENKTGRKVSTKENYLKTPESQKRLETEDHKARLTKYGGIIK